MKNKTTSKEKKSAKPQSSTKTPTPKETKKSGRDQFGGRLGTRMSKINLVVIHAGAKGATVPEIAEQTGESTSIVSQQLSGIFGRVKVLTRKPEKGSNGHQTFRYFCNQA